MIAPRTTVTMIYTEGDGATVFGVYRAQVRLRPGIRPPGERWSWNLHRATLVGTVRVEKGDARPSYRVMAERYATPAWPALEYTS